MTVETTEHFSKPKRNLLAFAVTFLISGFLSIIYFDSYFTDFWKIRECAPDGYSRGDYMTACPGIKIDRYSFGSIYFGTQKDMVQTAREADVLVFGNSRTLRSFATDNIDQYFRQKGLKYLVLASEGSSYNAAILTMESLELKPKIVLINNEITYSDNISEGFKELVDYPEKYETRFKFFYLAQTLQKKVCLAEKHFLKDFYCKGIKSAAWRDGTTGRIVWNKSYPDKQQKLITLKPSTRMGLLDSFTDHAEQLISIEPMKTACPVLYLVNSPISDPVVMDEMGKRLNLASVFVDVEGLTTYDNSHLDRPNSEKWAKPFVEKLDPAIDDCLKKLGQDTPATVDFDKIGTGGLSDFERWRNLNGATVKDNSAYAPDDPQSADAVYFEKRQSRLQKQINRKLIQKGDKLTYSVSLSSETPAKIRLQIIRACVREAPMESTVKVIDVTPELTEYSVSHTFENDQKCAYTQIMAMQDDTNIKAWSGMTVHEDAAPTE